MVERWLRNGPVHVDHVIRKLKPSGQHICAATWTIVEAQARTADGRALLTGQSNLVEELRTLKPSHPGGKTDIEIDRHAGLSTCAIRGDVRRYHMPKESQEMLMDDVIIFHDRPIDCWSCPGAVIYACLSETSTSSVAFRHNVWEAAKSSVLFRPQLVVCAAPTSAPRHLSYRYRHLLPR